MMKSRRKIKKKHSSRDSDDDDDAFGSTSQTTTASASLIVPNGLQPGHKCDICNDIITENTMKLLQCRGCMLLVHDGCYECETLKSTVKEVDESTPVNRR